MSPSQLRATVPFFADAAIIECAPLADVVSLNNANYRVFADGTAYLVRIGAETAHWLGIRRDEEQAAAQAAATVGVGPAVLYADRTGVLVQPFLTEARHWSADDARLPENIARIARTLRRLHTLTAVSATCSAYERIERLLASAAALGLEPPLDLTPILEQLATLRAERATDTRFAPGLCHQDFWLNNFLVEGAQLRLVDWEFAGIGDGLYDLATISLGAGYDEPQQTALLTAYGYTEPGDLALLQRMKAVVHCFEASWALVQHGLRGSSDGFDYLHYAQHGFSALAKQG